MHNTGALKANMLAAEVPENPCSHWFLSMVFTITGAHSCCCYSTPDRRQQEDDSEVKKANLHGDFLTGNCFSFFFFFSPVEGAAVLLAMKAAVCWLLTLIVISSVTSGQDERPQEREEFSVPAQCSGIPMFLDGGWLFKGIVRNLASLTCALPFR